MFTQVNSVKVDLKQTVKMWTGLNWHKVSIGIYWWFFVIVVMGYQVPHKRKYVYELNN